MTYWLLHNGPDTPTPFDLDDLDDIRGSDLDESIREDRDDVNDYDED